MGTDNGELGDDDEAADISLEAFEIIEDFDVQAGPTVNAEPKLLASDLVKDRLGANFEQLAERHDTSIFIVTANDIFPRASELLEISGSSSSPSTLTAALTDSYMSFAGQFRDVDSDISNNIRGGIFADEFRQGMMVESLHQREPVGKGFVTDAGTYYGVIVLPPLNTSPEKLAGYELNIDTQYFDDLPGTSADWMNWVIEHEATHVGQKHLNTGEDVQVLGNEIEADNGTRRNAAKLRSEGNDVPMQIVETVARLRSLNAVLTPVDNNHATGPAIGYDVTPDEVILATQDVRLKIHAAIAVKDNISIENASRLAINFPERAVREMRELQELGAFRDNEISERLATLASEAAEHHLSEGYSMDFDAADIDGYIERAQLTRNAHIYGDPAPDVEAVYDQILMHAKSEGIVINTASLPERYRDDSAPEL